MRFLLRSKINRAKVTEANINYVGSITIDKNLIEKTGLMEGERVLVTSVTSGARLETYVIAGEAGSGVLCMNGPTAHLILELFMPRICLDIIPFPQTNCFALPRPH